MTRINLNVKKGHTVEKAQYESKKTKGIEARTFHRKINIKYITGVNRNECEIQRVNKGNRKNVVNIIERKRQ